MRRGARATARRAGRAGHATARALILRRHPYGESSLVLHVLTPEGGRLGLLAKGAYRLSSGYCGAFDLFDTLELRFRPRPAGELGLVTAADVAVRRADVARVPERYTTALGLLELARMTGREGHEERTLFRWLAGGLDLLQAGRAQPGVVAVAADLSLLAANGLAPALDACASCGEVQRDPAGRDGRVLFSAALGGRVCERCTAGTRTGGLESLPSGVVRVARSLMGASGPMLENTRVEPALLERVRTFVARFLEYHLEARPRSRRAAPSRAVPLARKPPPR